jgi:chemotaxis protein MotC
MKRKELIYMVATVCTVSGAAATGASFFWPGLIQYASFLTSSPKSKHEESVAVNEKSDHSENPVKLEDGHGGEPAPTNDHGPLAIKSSDAVEQIAAAEYVAPGSRKSTIVQAMREITHSQTRMANGDEKAPPGLKMLMLQVPSLLNNTKPEMVSQSEIEAIALYVLSGGDPSNTVRFLGSEKLSSGQRVLLEGVKSYSKADFNIAAEKLLPLDVRQFEPFLAAQLAVAQAQLEPPSDFEKSVAKLGFAANMVPGSLVEEAAIRRILPHLARHGDTQKFAYWAQRYLRRFPNSQYYPDFERNFMLAASVLSMKRQVVDRNELARVFQTAGSKRTLPLARQILLNAIQTANINACTHAAEAVGLAYKIDDKGLEDISALVRVCQIIESEEAGLAALKQIEVTKLSTTVKKNLGQAIAMAETILANGPLKDDGNFGPHLPLSASVDYQELLASVTQQLEVSLVMINRVDDDETSY